MSPFGHPIFSAFSLAVVSGTLLAIGHYAGAAITGLLAVIFYAAWQRAVRRGEDQRDGIF